MRNLVLILFLFFGWGVSQLFGQAYRAQIVSAKLGSSTWCPGEIRNVTVTIRNIGTATWTNGAPDINIGVKWNTNGTSWADYNVRTDANNLAPGATGTYNLPLTASNNTGGAYGSPLAAGSNNITFDVVYEGLSWFGNNGGGVGPGNTVFTSATQTILTSNTVTRTSAVATTAQTACINSPITPITYLTTGATGATFSGLPTGVAGNWAGNVVTINGTPTVSGSFNYTLTTTGGCPQAVATGTITVAPTNTLILTSAAATTAQAVCINTPIIPITLATTGANGATVTNLPAGVTGTWAGNVVTISGTPTVAGAARTYTVTLAGGCGSITRTGTIAVTASNTLTQTSAPATTSQTVCINTPITPITYATTGATGATFTNLPLGVTGSWAGNVVTISGTPTEPKPALAYTVILTGGCETITTVGTIAVNPDNTITRTSTAATTTQAVCVNTPITPITYSTTGARGATFSNLPTGVSGSWAGNVVTISGTPTIAGAALSYTVTLTEGCGTITTTGSIAVTPNNSLTLTSAAATTTQAVCINTAIIPITYVTTGATNATFTNLPAGVTGTWSGNVVTISGTPTVAGAARTYTVTLTGGCGTGTTTGTIAVKPDPIVNIGGALAAICQGATSAQMGGSVGGSATGGTWSGGTGIWTNANNPATATYTAGAAESGSITLTLTSSGSTCGTTFRTKTITITPIPTANSGPALPAICQGATSAAMAGIVGGGATGGTWSGGAGSWTNATNSATATYTAGATESGSITLTLTTSGGSCGTTTVTKTITVNSNPKANPGAALPAICQGATSAAMGGNVSGGATGGTWSGGAGTWTNANNPTTATYTANPSESGSITLTLSTSGGSCGTTFVIKTITVNQNPTANAGGDLAAICQGGTSAALGGSFGGGATSAIWSSNGGGTFSNNSGATPETATFTAASNSTSPITLTLTASGGSCGTITTTKAITVNPTPAITNIVTSVCTDGTFTVIPVNGTNGNVPAGTTYSWSAPIVTGGMTGGAAGTSANSISGTLRNTNNSAQTATYTVTPITGSCTGAPFTVIVTVNITTKINFSPDNTNRFKCFGDGFPPLTVGAIGGDLTYQWYSNTTQSNSGGTLIVGAESVSYSPPSTVEGVTYYYVVVAGACGNETSLPSGGYTVNPSKTLITVDPSDVAQTVCLGDTFTALSASASGEGMVNYQWYSNSTPSNTGGTLILNATDSTFIPPATSEGNIYYYAEGSSNCGTVPTAVSGSFTVLPLPIVTNSSTASICSGTSPNIALTASTPSNFTWTIGTITGSITGASAGSGAAINQALTNPSNSAAGTVQYIVTPNSITGTCPGTPFTITVTVIPRPIVTNPPTTITCSGTGPNINLTASTLSNFTWTIGIITGGITGASTGSGATLNQALTNPSNVTSGTVQYVVTPTSIGGSCTGAPFNITVTVNPRPAVTNLSTVNICSGTSPNIALTATTPSNFTWTIGTITGGITGATPGSGANINQVLTNPSNVTVGTVQYIVIPISITGTCPGTPFTITVTVTPRPVVTNPATAIICSGTGPNIALTASTPSNFTWTIGTITGGITGASAGSGANINQVLTNPSNVTVGTVQYIVTPNSITGTCPGTPFTITVTVTPRPVVTNPATAITCSGTGPNITLTASTPSNFIWTIGTITGGIIGASAGSGASINQALTNPNNSAGTVQYIVTPTSTTGTCSGASSTITVTVNPAPIVNAITDRVYCHNQGNVGTGITFGNNIGGGGTTSYAWTSTANVGFGLSGMGNIAAYNPQNITSAPITATISVISTRNGCVGPPRTFTITVNPIPTVNVVPNQIFCAEETTAINFTSPVAGTTFTWSYTGGNIGLPSSGTGNIPAFTAENNGTTNITRTFTVLASANGCNSVAPPRTFTVTIRPLPIVISPVAVCEGSTANLSPTTGGTWTSSNPAVATVNNAGLITGVAAGSVNFTFTNTSTGCSRTTNNVTINPKPVITILADYCAVGGRVQLIASSNIPGMTWSWNTSPVQTSSSILVDLSGNYTVTGTSPAGCITSASISVAQELVVDGDFTNFNPASPSFFTEYTQNQNFYQGNPASGLWPETLYAVNTSANSPSNGIGYHPSFHGRDHTNNAPATGPRNFMMINGATTTIGSPPRQRIIWQQTVTVQPNTEYYFSAWAMNLNPSNPARLQFEVNGVLVGTVADLNSAPKPTNNGEVNLNNWVRFYSDPTWNSGTATTAVIRIRNLNTIAGGNDFGLDDISFGTLSTFINLTSAVGTDNQTVCQDSPITDITYTAGSGVAGPTVTNLPPGITTSWNGVTLRFNGSPTIAGTYNYTVTTTGNCLPATASGTIVVRATPTAGAIAAAQTVCIGGDPVAFTSTAAGTGDPGSTFTYRWESNNNLTTPNWTAVAGNPSGATYNAPALSATTQYRRITIATAGSVATNNLTVCESAPTVPVQVTVQTVPPAGAIGAAQTICTAGDPAPFTSIIAGTGNGTVSYLWESNTNLSTPSWSTVSGQTGATYDAPAGLTATTQYRRTTISTLNGVACQSIPTSTITVTVNQVPTAGAIAMAQTICTGGDPAAFTSTTAGTGTGIISYRWESAESPISSWSTITGASSATYDVPAGLTVKTRYRRVTLAESGGVTCESAPTADIEVTVQRVPTAGAIAAAQAICSGGDPSAFTSTTAGTGDGTITYRWESAVSPFSSWTAITGANSATYDVPSGLTTTTQYRRVTISTLNGRACESAATATIQVTISPNNTVTASTPKAVCINTSLSPTITHSTTGATGIVSQGAGVSYNLPNGVTAIWAVGVLTISGTPTEVGIFNYNIPLAGGCGSVNATGTITISNPSYPISSISVVNPALGTPPYTSTFTVFSPGFTAGTYTLVYSTSGINQVANQTITATATTLGQLTFSSLPYSTEGTSILTIVSIQRDTDLCPYSPPNNTAPYGVNCSSEFTGDDIFYVPAGVSQVTIQAFGADPTDSETIAVLPSGVIFIVFDGTDVFATEAPPSVPMADRLAQAIVRNISPNGRIVFNYDCTPLPCSGSTDVVQYTDDEGFTIIRFTGACDWIAPDGLDEFEVLVVGGGGGGGYGDAAGGGGGGAVIYEKYTGITMNGLPGLQGADFRVTPGSSGNGAILGTLRGGSGLPSSVDGPQFDYLGGNTFTELTAAGGGGGGSTGIRQGANGASGGGGAASGTLQSAGGAGSAGNNGGNGNGQTFGSSGAGGGGVTSHGADGGYSGGGQVMIGGTGGTGEERTISGDAIYYGAGGGATSSRAIVNLSGSGGSPYSATNGNQLYAGGSGNNNGIGQLASTYGSGGGAGRLGGSSGFPGVVYIRYPNFRILPVEYLYFNAKYNSFERAGDLTWATDKEWENDRFEIERSVNNVKEWEAIGEVAGAGYSDKEVKYDYSDIKLPIAGGNIFYRLKQYDFDGDFAYSDTKSIKVEALPGTTHWRVFPNPTTGTPFNIEILDPSAYQDEPITLRIISATGQFETIQVSEMKQMGAQVSEWFTTRASGIYTIEISWGTQREYHKVILRR